MTMMQNAVEIIKMEEGYRAHSYRDHLGKITIGIGFMIDPDEPGNIPIPENVSDLWMLDILRRRKVELDLKISWWKDLSEDRQVALMNMAYQLGVSGLMKFKNMLKALQEGRYDDASTEALDSRWAKQTPLRARRVAKILAGEKEK